MSSSLSSSDSDDSQLSWLVIEESLNVSDEAEESQYWWDSDTCIFCSKVQESQDWEYSAICGFCTKNQILQGSEEPPPSPNFSSKKKPGRAVKPINLENEANNGNRITSTAVPSNDWCPLDDGIFGIFVPTSSSEKISSIEDAVNTHIDTILHGPFLRKRLPVFTEFCPE